MATAMVNTAAITETANNRFDNPGQAVNPSALPCNKRLGRGVFQCGCY